MPLCPQITNTPITVTQTADFTVSSVLPVVPATTTQLDAVEVLVNGKAEIYYQTTAPVGAGINENDLWYDTDDGNKPYVFRSGVWVSAQDGSIATAQSAANTALANAATANAVGVAAQGTANTALANAAIADAKGVAAQSTANTALANAATAYTAAIGSLQPSANTIVNASNQMTAINGGGITVYSGASASSGARVVLNSAGLAGFDSGGTATFSITASTGAAVFSGSVTGSTITGGTLNIGGNAIIDASGFLTATGATITGTITTSNITVTGGTLTIGSTFAVTAGGVLTATGATITGTLTSNNVTITGGTLTIGSKFSVTSLGVLTATDGVFTGTITSTNATITGGSLTVGSTFSVTSAGVLTASSGTIGGSTLSSSTITGGTIQTAASGASVSLDGANNALKFTNSAGTAVGWILPYSSNGMVFNYGASPGAGFSAFPAIAIGSTSILLQPDSTNSLSVSTSGISATSFTSIGTFTASNAAYIQDSSTTANASNARIDVGDGRLRRSTASSGRFKEQITDIANVAELNPNKLLDLPVRAFKFKADYLDPADNRAGVLVPGLIAEEVAQFYPAAADSTNGVIENWNERFIIPGLLALIQNQEKRIKQLEGE
jgi:hypothetical protein